MHLRQVHEGLWLPLPGGRGVEQAGGTKASAERPRQLAGVRGAGRAQRVPLRTHGGKCHPLPPVCAPRPHPGTALGSATQKCPRRWAGGLWGLLGMSLVRVRNTNRNGTLGFMVKTWARHKTRETVLDNLWRLVAVGGWRLAVGGWWRLAVGGWQLAVGGWWRLAVGGWWRLAVGGWRLAAVGGGWRSLRAVLEGCPQQLGFLRTALSLVPHAAPRPELSRNQQRPPSNAAVADHV